MLRCLDKCQAVLPKNTMVLPNGLLFWDSTYNKVQYFENTKVSQQQYRNEMENPSYKEAGLGDTHTPQTFTSRNPTQPGIV